MSKIYFLLTIFAILGLASCQNDVEKADSLRLENKFDEAFELYQKASDDGDPYATWRLAYAYRNGDGVDLNEKKATELVKKAAEGGCDEAKYDLAMSSITPGDFDVPLDTIKGKNSITKLVDTSDNSYVQSRYAYLLLTGVDDVFEKNIEKAERILKKVKDKDDPYYLGAMGYIYHEGLGDITKDIDKSIEYFTRSFEKGWRYSSCVLGGFYLDKDDKKYYNRDKGIEWLNKGVQSNSTYSMITLAQIYLCSPDDSLYKDLRNPSKGIELLEKAGIHGGADAYWVLGQQYFNGINVNKDDKKSFECYQRAYELKSPTGANNLGAYYLQGIGCKKDIKKAIKIWEDAVKYGSGFAAKNLYQIYRFGIPNEGIPMNYNRQKAKYYLLQGAKLNEPTACVLLSYQYYPGGDLFETNTEQAFAYAMRAAEADNADGCQRVAQMYDQGIGVQRDPKQAEKYRQKAGLAKKDDNN